MRSLYVPSRRVAELEQENARLLALTQNGSQPQPTSSDPALLSEVEQLRAQLAAAQERERELAAKLVSTTTVGEVPVKVEASESYVPPASPSSRSLSVPSANKTAASLGLMVCSIHSVWICPRIVLSILGHRFFFAHCPHITMMSSFGVRYACTGILL